MKRAFSIFLAIALIGLLAPALPVHADTTFYANPTIPPSTADYPTFDFDSLNPSSGYIYGQQNLGAWDGKTVTSITFYVSLDTCVTPLACVPGGSPQSGDEATARIGIWASDGSTNVANFGDVTFGFAEGCANDVSTQSGNQNVCAVTKTGSFTLDSSNQMIAIWVLSLSGNAVSVSVYAARTTNGGCGTANTICNVSGTVLWDGGACPCGGAAAFGLFQETSATPPTPGSNFRTGIDQASTIIFLAFVIIMGFIILVILEGGASLNDKDIKIGIVAGLGLGLLFIILQAIAALIA